MLEIVRWIPLVLCLAACVIVGVSIRAIERASNTRWIPTVLTVLRILLFSGIGLLVICTVSDIIHVIKGAPT